MENQVHVLFTGYSHADEQEPKNTRANCTCTLIRTHTGRNIIIDTMTAWDGDRILTALDSRGLKPEQINAVVATHGHSDHIGCNYLFQRAQFHVVGSCVSQRDKYLDWGGVDCAPFRLDGDNVTVQRTPGHTNACVSVLVRNSQLGSLVGICGDLFERVEDIENSSIWINAGSENPQSQREQRLRLAEKCDYIIPGHGPGFIVTTQMREKLRKDVEQQSKS